MAELDLPRRAVVRGFAVTGIAAVVGFLLARQSDAVGPRAPTAAANSYGAAPGDGGPRLAALADVPPGGGLVVADQDVVLVHDDADGVRGFSATCTHQGCTVSSVEAGTILCPCHGSAFDARTGEPVAGPATAALAQVPVTVDGDSVFTA